MEVFDHHFRPVSLPLRLLNAELSSELRDGIVEETTTYQPRVSPPMLHANTNSCNDDTLTKSRAGFMEGLLCRRDHNYASRSSIISGVGSGDTLAPIGQ